uniref:Uncharacterized protein n=1 Tax=Plectus sambesii TaxID=2011161 RepID=A0A914V237_9BILA
MSFHARARGLAVADRSVPAAAADCAGEVTAFRPESTIVHMARRERTLIKGHSTSSTWTIIAVARAVGSYGGVLLPPRETARERERPTWSARPPTGGIGLAPLPPRRHPDNHFALSLCQARIVP